MRTGVYYFTGTGNSFWTAKQLALNLKGSTLQYLNDKTWGKVNTFERIILVFPVHMWGLPHRIIRAIQKWIPQPGQRMDAIAVNAGQVASTLLQLKHLLKRKEVVLHAGFSLEFPSNYTPWGGPGTISEQQNLFTRAEKRLQEIIPPISADVPGPVERGPLWQNLLFSLIYRMSFKYIPFMDRDFWVDERCNACAVCQKVCPADNIRIDGKKPVWQHHCEQCLACLQWCPQTAVQFGKNTSKYERYHHPAIKVKELLQR